MKKQKKGRKFHRKKNQRVALLRSIANSIFIKGRIKTTEEKAKEARRLIEKSITLAKKKDHSSRRR
jgi:large subunit ribosomal protein L17